MNTNNPKDDFLAKWLDGQLSEGELQARGASGDLNGLSQVVEETSRFEVPATRTKEQMWEDFLVRVQEQESEVPPARVIRFSRKPLIATAIAASVAILLLVYLWLPRPQQINNRMGAEPLAHVLPDGSSTVLNDESSLSYEAGSWDENRELELKGEAFFQVEKGSRFLVHTAYGDVQVLGTSFNVYARDGRLEVECFTGKVQVKDKNSSQFTILSRGEGVILADGQIQQSSEETSEEAQPGWVDGSFRFRKAPFSMVAAEVERQFNVKIAVEEELKDQQWSGVFFDDNLEETLKMICEPMGLTYIQENATHIKLINKP